MTPTHALQDIVAKLKEAHGDDFTFDRTPRYQVVLSGIEIERMLQALEAERVDYNPAAGVEVGELLSMAPRDLPARVQGLTWHAVEVTLETLYTAIEHLSGLAVYIRARRIQGLPHAEAELAACRGITAIVSILRGKSVSGHCAAKFMRRSRGCYLPVEVARKEAA